MIWIQKLFKPKTKAVTFVMGGTVPSIFGTRLNDDCDIVDREGTREKYEEMYRNRSSLTATQRLSLMWRMDELSEMSPELTFVYNTTSFSILAGVAYGTVADSKKTFNQFLEKNKYEMFKHPREAQSALQDRMLLSYMKGAWRYGWRMAIVGFTYSAVSQSMTAARNYVNPLDHALAGSVMGAVYRFNMGPKGMLGAGFIGSVLGLQVGILFWGIQYISGQTVEERWAEEYDYIKQKINSKAEAMRPEDPRDELLGIKTDTDKYLEERDWFRDLIISITDWGKEHGMIRSSTPFSEDFTKNEFRKVE